MVTSETECDSGRGRGPGLRPLGLEARDGARSCTGRGEMGTFQRLASSGNSSSESWYSSSKSCTVLRGRCHDGFRLRVGVLTGFRDRLCVDGDELKLDVGRSGDVERER